MLFKPAFFIVTSRWQHLWLQTDCVGVNEEITYLVFELSQQFPD